jgi:hypothetical protein
VEGLRTGSLQSKGPPDDDALSAAESAQERKRELKWIKLLGPELDLVTGEATGNLRRFQKDHPDAFERLVMEGIPDTCRGRVWYELLDRKPPGRSGKVRPTVQELFERATPAADHVIRSDVPRTLWYVEMFTKKDVQESLYRVLRAYSNDDPEFGYFQGMPFSAGILLSYMDETRTFWAFWQLMKGKKHQFRLFCLDDYSRLRELSKVWEVVLQKKYPKLAQHLKKIKINPMLYTPGWFLTGFQSIHFSKSFRLRLFDRQIAFGSRALLSFALTIVSIGKKQLKTGGPQVCLLLLQNPLKVPGLANWRDVIKWFDSHFLTREEYTEAFRLAGIPVFP